MTLVAHDLEVARGDRTLIKGLSFEIAPGSAVMLRGPNGVGKTTLLRAIAGLGSLAKGEVRFGKTPLQDRDAWSDVVVYGGHADAMKAQLSVRENLEFRTALYGSNVSTVLDAFDLEGISDRLAGNCSAGQRRRLGLARIALAGRPVWLLDEPTVSLDASATGLLARALERHLEAGGIALVASHEGDLVERAETLALEPLVDRRTIEEEDPFLVGDML